MRQVLRAEAQKGVTDRGITEFAFKKLLLMFITQSRPDSTWTVLRYFHYNQDLELEIPEDVLDVTHLPDQIVELNDTGVRFLIDIFEQFSVNNVLPVRDVEYIFSIAPSGSHPFGPQFPFNTHCNKEGALTCGGWLSAWSYVPQLEVVLLPFCISSHRLCCRVLRRPTSACCLPLTHEKPWRTCTFWERWNPRL